MNAYVSVMMLALATFSAGCKAMNDVGEKGELGPRVGVMIQATAQKTSDETYLDEASVPSIYTEGAYASGMTLMTFSWGMEAWDRIYFEPILYVGNGGGQLDNGNNELGQEAKFDDYDGTALGAGFKSRIRLDNTLVRVGLDARYLVFEGDSDYNVDNLPALNEEFDGVTKNLEILGVLEYNDPRYRPYLAAGISAFFIEFESKTTPSYTVEVEPRRAVGAKGGVEFHNIGDSGFYSTIELGWFGGPQIVLSTGIRF